MSDIDLYHAYERFKLPPDADQDEIRRVYVQLRQELDGEDLRRLYTAWDNLLSPQNRVRVDAMLLQVDGSTPTLDELLAEIEPAAIVTDWNSFIDHAALLQRETAKVTSLILEHTWLGHAYSKIFTREAPVADKWPLPQPSLTPVTHAARPVTAEEAPPAEEPSPRQLPTLQPVWAGVLLAVLLIVFAGLRSQWFNSPSNVTTAMTAPTTQRFSLALPVADYDAPSRSFVVPTPTPFGQRPILVIQATPPPALTAPITSAALIDQLRERLERTTEIVETQETDFARSISFGSVQPASLLPVASPFTLPADSTSPQATPTVSPQPTPTDEPTQPPAPTPTATAVPILMQSLNYINVRSGPGTEFDVVEVIEPESRRRVLARTPSAAWLLIETTNGEGGWVSTSVVALDGDVGQVEIRD